MTSLRARPIGRLLAISLALLGTATAALAGGPDVVTGSTSSTSTTVDQSLVVVLTDDPVTTDGIAGVDSVTITFSRPLTGTFFPPAGTPINFTNATSVAITQAALGTTLPNGWQGFLVIRPPTLTPSPLPYDVTLSDGGMTTLPPNDLYTNGASLLTGVTWTAGALDHFDMTVTGSTTPNVNVTTAITCRAEDAFGNLIGTYASSPMVALFQNDQVTPATGAPNPTTIAFAGGTANLTVSNNYAEGPIAVRLTNAAPAVSSFADKRITWQQQPVQSYTLSTGTTFTAAATVATLTVNNLTVASGLKVGDAVVLSLPGDWDLSSATANTPTGFGAGAINPGARTVTWLKTGAFVGGNSNLQTVIGAGCVFTVSASQATTFTQGQSITVSTTRDTALATSLTVNGAGAQGLKAPPPPTGATANANTAVLLQILNDDSIRESYQTNESGVSYTFRFATTTALPANGTLVLDFEPGTNPSDFGLSGARLAGWSGIDGGASATINNATQQVFLVRDGTGSATPGGTVMEVRLEDVTNPPTASSSPANNRYSLTLETYDAPFTGAPGPNLLDNAGGAGAPTNRITGVDFRGSLPDEISFQSTPAGFPNLAKGSTVTFAIQDVDLYEMANGEKFWFVLPPFGPSYSNIGGGFVFVSAPADGDLPAATADTLFGSSTTNAALFTANGNNDNPDNDMTITVTLPNFAMQGVRFFIMHESTDNEGAGRCFAVTPSFNVVDTGNLAFTGGQTPPARATNGGARIGSAPTNTTALYDVDFTHTVAVPSDGFVDVTTLAGDSFWSIAPVAGGMTARNLVVTGVRFGPDYRGVAATGADDNKNTDNNGRLHLQLIRNANPALDVIQLRDDSGFGSGTLVAEGTMGTSNGLGAVILAERNTSGISGSVVITTRGAVNSIATATPSPVTHPAAFKPHSIRIDNGRSTFRWRASAGAAAGAKIFTIGDSTTDLVTISTLPQDGGATVQIVAANGTTVLEGPTTTPFSATGQAIEGPGAGNAPTIAVSHGRTYETVTTTTLRFATHSEIPVGGTATFSFPASFVITPGALTGTWLTNPRLTNTGTAYVDPTGTGSTPTATFDAVGQTLLLTNTGLIAITPGYHTVTFTSGASGLRNPALPGSFSGLSVQTFNGASGPLDPAGPGAATATSLPALAISGHNIASTDPIVAASAVVTPLGTGDTATCTVNFTTRSDIPVVGGGGVLRFRFIDPDGSLDVSTTNAATWTPTGNPTNVVGSFTVVGSAAGTVNPLVTLTRTGGGGEQLLRGAMVVSFTIKNPRRAATSYAVQVETSQTAGLIDQSDGVTPTFTTTGGAVTAATLTGPLSVTAGSVGATYDVSFTTQSFLPPGAFIELSLPPGTAFDSPAATAITQVTIPTVVPAGAGSLGAPPALVKTPGSPPTATILRITNSSASTIRNGIFRLQVSNLRNTTRAGTYAISIRTLQSDGTTVIDSSATTSQTVTVQGGTFAVTSSPPTVTAGATNTSYQFDYRLNADVVAGNALDVGFPLGFNVGTVGGADVTLAVDADGAGTYTTVPGANYTVTPQGDNVTVRLTLAVGTTIDASSTPFVRITVTDVRNTTLVAPHTYTSLRTVNTGNGTTIDAASVLPAVTVDGAGFAPGSVTYGVAPAAADQQTSTHTHTFQMGSTLPADGLVTVVFEDPEVKLASGAGGLAINDDFTGTAGDKITWAGIDGGYTIRAIQHTTSAGVSRTGLVLERDTSLGANGDTSPVRHAIQLVNVVTNTSVLGDTRYRINTFRNPTTLRPRLRADGASGQVTFVSTSITGAQVFANTDLTGAIYLEVTGVGPFTITAFKDVGRDPASQIGQIAGVAASTNGVTIPCAAGAFNVVVDVGVLTGTEVDVVETLWRIDPPNVTAAGNEDRSGPATIIESLAQNVNDVVSPPAKGAASTHTVSFTTPVVIRGVAPAQHVLRIELDKAAAQTSEFSFANVAASPGTNFAWTVNGAPVPGASVSVVTDPAPNAAVLWVTYTGATDLPSGNHVLTLSQVLNSNDEGTDFFARVSLYRRVNTTPNPDILDLADRVITETNTPNFSLSGAQLTNVTATPTESRAARPSGYTFRFRSLTQIPATGQVRIVFPKDVLELLQTFNLASLDGKVLGGAVGSWAVDLDGDGSFEQALAGARLEVDPTDVSGSTLVISRKDAVGILGNGTTTVGHEIIILNDALSNVVNVDTKGSYSLAMSTHSYGGTDETAGSIIEGPNQSSPPFNLVGDVVTVTGVTLTPNASGDPAAQHMVSFTTSTRLPNNARLVFTYDGGADTWANVTPGFVSGSSTPDDLINFAFSAGVLSADRDASGTTLAPGTYSVVLTGFTNSTNRHREHRITLETRDALNVPIDLAAPVLNTFPPKFIVQPGQLSSVTLTPTPTTAGNDNATHAIDLTTVSAIPKDGRLFVRYSDAGFDLSNVTTPEVTLSGVADPLRTTVELATTDGRIVILLDGALTNDLAPATRTLTLTDVTNTFNAASNHTVQVVLLASGATVPVAGEPFGAVGIGGSINLAAVNGQPTVVVPGTVVVSTGAAFTVDEIAGTITFPAGSAAGSVSYSRYPVVVPTSTGSPIPIDLAATSANFSITGGPATKIRFDNLTSGSVRNRQGWPASFSFQLLDAADNPTTQTGGNPIVLSFTSTETAASATLQWAGVAGGGGTASVPLAAVSATGTVVLDQLSFRGRLTGTEPSPGFNKADIDLSATIGVTPLTLVGAAGTNRVKVIPGDFALTAWPDTLAQQTVDTVFTGSLVLQALDADGNRPPTPTTTPNLRILPRTGPTTGGPDETVKGAILNLSGGGDQVDGASLDGGVGTFDLVANGAKYVGPTGVVFLHVHQVAGDTHVSTIDTDTSGDPATFLPRNPIQVSFVAGEAARVNWTLASAFGRRVSGSSPATTLGAGTYQFTVALNGDTPAPTATLVLGAAITNDGPALAAAIQTAIRNMTASAGSLQQAYSQARVAFTGGRFVVISGLTTSPSSVGSIIDTLGTAMDTVKLTDGQGASGLTGDPAAVYTVDALFPSGAAFELQDAGGNPTTNVGPDFIRLRLTSTSNPGFDTPRLSYEAPTAAVLPAVMTEATPSVDFVDLLPPGTTTNLGNVLRYGGGHNNGLPMRMSVLVAREDAGNSPRTVQTTAGSPLVITQTAADWAPNNLVGKTVLFTSGPAFGRRAVIASNTASTLTIVEPLAPSIRTLTGTVSYTNASATVTGTGTLFTSELRVGHRLEFASEPGTFYIVQAIGSDTSLTLSATPVLNGTNVIATRGGAPQPGDTIELYTTTELSVVSSQVDGVDNTVVFTPAKVARFTLTGLVGTFRVNLTNPGTLQAQDRYGNPTNNVGAGAVFGLTASPPPVGAPFTATNTITNLPDGGGTSVLTNRFTNGVATVSPTYLGAALASGTQSITIGITVDGGPVTVINPTYFVDAGSPRHIRWVGLQGQTLHAGRPLNDAAAPAGLGSAGAGPWAAQLFDAAGNAIAPSDVPATAPSGIRVDVANGGGFPNLDLSLADSTQTDAVSFGSGNVLTSAAFTGNAADLAGMRFLGRASQSNGHALSATLVEPGPIETLLIPVTLAPQTPANPAANPTFTVRPGALAHFHWGLANSLVQQPSQALDPGGSYLVHAHDANHNRLGSTAPGEAYEARANTPIAGAGFDLATNAGTTPELVYLFVQNGSDPIARINFGSTDPGFAAPLLGRIRLDKTGTTPFNWSGGTFRLGPSPDADLRYFGINGDVQVNVDVSQVTPGRTIGPVAGTVDVTNASATVTGNLTSFTTQLVVGERLEFDSDPGVLYEIASILNDTQLTLTTPYGSGTTLGAQATSFRPILANVTNASDPNGATATDFLRIGAGDVDHFWFKDATASEQWTEAQTNDVTWNTPSAGSQIIARDVAGNSINTYTIDGEDVRLITYETHAFGTATAYNGGTFTVTFSGGAITAPATPDNLVLVNRRTGSIAKITGVAGTSITLENPGLRFGAAADNTLILNSDVLDVLVRLNPTTWRFAVGDANTGTTRNGGGGNDQPQILKSQFDFAGGTFSINDTSGVPGANGFKWTGAIPANGTIVVRPVINLGGGVFEHRGVRVGLVTPTVPATGGLSVPMSPGAVTNFLWTTAGTQRNAVPFTGINTLTAVDVSNNVNTAFNGATTLGVQVASSSRIPPTLTNFVSAAGASPSTQFTTIDPTITSAVIGQTVHLFTNGGAPKAEAVIVAFDSGTGTLTTTTISPAVYVGGGTPDQFVIDPVPPGATPVLSPGQINAVDWSNGVANLTGLNFQYAGVGNGLSITLSATSGLVSATSNGIVMNAGDGAKVALLYRGNGLGSGGSTLPDELVVQGAPSGAGGNPTLVRQLTPVVFPNQSLLAKVVVLDQNNNLVAAPGASTASVLNSDPFGTQGPQATAWNGSGEVPVSVLGRTVNGLIAPPATRSTPGTWSLSATNSGGFATPAGVSNRTFQVVTDGVQRVEYIFDHADAASGTFNTVNGDSGTATNLTVGVGTPFTASMAGMVVVNTTNVGAYGRISTVTANSLTFNALQGFDPTRAGPLWQDGDAWRVVPMYHTDGMISSIPLVPGVEGVINTRVLTAGTPVSGRVLLLDSGSNITASQLGDAVTVTTTDPFDALLAGSFANGVFSFNLTPRQAAHSTGAAPPTKDETDSFTISFHQLSINATGPSIGGGVVQEGGNPLVTRYQIVPGPATNVLLLVSPPSEKIVRGNSAAPISGTPPLQTAGGAFLVQAFVVDQDNNPVDYDGTITFNLPFGGAAGPFTVTDGDTGNGSFVTVSRFGAGLFATPNNPVPALTAPALLSTSAFDVKPGAPSHALVYVSAATSGGGVETLANGVSAAGDPPTSLTLSGGTLAETAGLDNVTVTAALTDAFSNPVLLFELLPAGDRRARVVTTDPNNPAFDFVFTTSPSTFVPTYSYPGFPTAGTAMTLATLGRTMTLTRAQLAHRLDVDLATLTDDVVVAPTPHQSRAIRINPGAASNAVIVLPGQTLNTGAKTGQPVFFGTPDDQVEGVEFPVQVFSVDAFFNRQFADSSSTLSTLRTDEGTDYVGGLGFRLSGEGAVTLINNGQLEFTSLNGLVISPQLPFANGSTGPEVADEIQQAVRDQTIAVSEATTKFSAQFLPEFSRYLLISGQATKGAGPTSSIIMGANTSAGLNLGGPGSGANGVLSPNAATFTSGVLAFTQQHAVAADVHFLRADVNVGGALVIQSENYRVLKPDFAFASVTMLDDGQGKIDRARIVFTLGADPTSIAGAASRFEVKQTKAGNVVSLLGNSISLLSTAAANDTIDVFFSGKLPTTSVDDLTLSYTRPQSGGLRADLDSGGKPLETTIRTNLNGAGEILDGAVPALVNVTREDSDGNGGLDLMRFVFSESVGFAAGAGFCKSSFDAGDATVSGVDDAFLIELDGDGPQAVVLGDLQTGTAVASAIQAAVRAMTANDPLKQRAYDNFTATYDTLNGRYLLRSGVGLDHDGARYLVDWSGSSIVVTTSGVNDGATNLGLAPGLGYSQAGFGDAQPGFSVSSAAPGVMEVTAGSADQLRLQLGGDAPRLISLSITVDSGTTPALDDRGRAIAARLQTVVRQIVSPSPSLQGAYGGFTALWDPVRDQLVLASGVTGPGATVSVSPTATPQDASANLALGVDNGGTELGSTSITGALARPIDDLIILSQDGRLNLLAGRTNADVVVVGNRVDVRLTNVPASGTAMPRFLWLDAGDGGFVTDLTPAPRSLPESTNVTGLGGRLALVLDLDGVSDDVLKVSAGDTVLDATQSLPPLGSIPGTRVVYRWEQVDDTTDPATLVIDNGDGVSPLGSSTANFGSPLATILGATAPGDYDLRLVITIVDQNGVPVPNAFTDGSGQVIREFRLQVADEPPVAIISNPDPLVISGSVALDGTASVDPNGGALAYAWSVVNATNGLALIGAFDDATSATPTFSPPGSGVFVVTLRVATLPALPDASSPSDTLYVSNGLGGVLPPYADPGPDRTARVRVPVVLDGALSHPDDAQAYEWTLVSSPAPVQLTFNATRPGAVQFTPSSPGPYKLSLVVRDSGGLVSAPRTVTVMAVDDLAGAPRFPPVARPRVVGLRRSAFLDASPTSDPQSAVLDDGQLVSLEAFLPAGSPAPASGLIAVDVVVGGTTESRAFVRVPSGRDVAALRLPDGTDSDVISFARNGDQLTLDGSQSQSATSVVSDFTWRQVGGPFAFSSRSGGILGLAVVTGLYEFELVVQDSAGIGSRPARLKIQVLPTGSDGEGPPTAIATGPARIPLGQSGDLVATSSIERADGSLTFAWQQVLGPGCSISGAASGTARVNPTVPGVYAFEVRVTDDNGVSDEAEVSFAVDGVNFDAPVATLSGATTLALTPGTVDVAANLRASSTPTTTGGQIDFVWTQLDGSPVFVDTLDDDAEPKLRLRSPGRYVFAVRAVVSDASAVLQASSAPATATFFVTGGEDVALVNGGFQSKSSGGCALSTTDGRAPTGSGWPLAALAALLLALRVRPSIRSARAVAALVAALMATGCGAAYYGSAAAIFASQKKTSKITTTAPDPAVGVVEGPAFATLVVGTTLTQDESGASGLPLLEVRFPDGYGESRSDRGAGEQTVVGDELAIAINGDEPQTIALAASGDGQAVAADIQAKVRALTPGTAEVPAAAYTLFTCVFDDATREYTLRSGVPGGDSAVVVDPADDDLDDSAADATAASLRLGIDNGGTERTGADNVRFALFNHGDDVLPAGTAVNMYLSRIKGVDDKSILIRSEPTPLAVEVSKARRFTSRNQAVPRTVLAVAASGQVLVAPGQYYLVLELERDSDKIVDDNVRAMVLPVQVNAPFGGFPVVSGGSAPPDTAPLDFAPVAFEAPIAVVTSARTVCSLTLSNGGAEVLLPTPLTTDVILGTDDEFVPPTALSDPDALIAGLFVNPIDVARQSSLVLDPTGVGPGIDSIVVAGSVVTIKLAPASTTVAALASAVDADASARTVLEVRSDEVGDDGLDTLQGLFTAVGASGTVTLPTGGRLIHRQTLVFAATPAQQTRQTYVLDVAFPAEDRFASLPQRFTVFVRATPPTGATPEDDSNNVRRSVNYTRVYGESTATFDNGVLLPTLRSSDFARLEPVTQRPVNTGSILQGQQRVFRFEIPNTGVALNESQLLVIVRTSTFDPHLELLDSTARPIARSDDSALGLDSMLYVPVAANQNQLAFYLVISNALLEDSNIGGGGASFDLTISVNPRQPGDSSLTQAVVMEELFLAKSAPVADDPASGYDENNKLIPFDLAQKKSEVLFVLPGRARVRFRTTPVFDVSVNPIITRFNEGEVPTALQFQAEVDPATLEIVYRPSNGTIASSHALNPGVYTITFNSLEGPDARDFILEVDADFIPQDVN